MQGGEQSPILNVVMAPPSFTEKQRMAQTQLLPTKLKSFQIIGALRYLIKPQVYPNGREGEESPYPPPLRKKALKIKDDPFLK